MQISKHAYGTVFESLIEGIKGDVILTKTAGKKSDPVLTGMDVFSSTTANTFQGIQEEEFNMMIAELQFAADKAKIALTQEDVSSFVARAYKDGLRGKTLEREASKFCNQINREVAAPEGAVRLSSDQLFETITHHKVVNASYSPNVENATNETNSSGRYMGCIRNPNSIWDSEAMQQLATKKHGDEAIKTAQLNREETIKTAKQEHWNEIASQLQDPNLVQKGIIKSAQTTSQEPVGDQKLPANSMSIFSNDREFSNIPERSVGDMIKEAATKRANKSKEAKEEWNKVTPSQKANDGISVVFKD